MKDVLLLVPPFFSPDYQSLGLHNLQACARQQGYTVDINYINLGLAERLGEVYYLLWDMNYFQLGERVFAKAAWGDLVEEQFDENLFNYREIYEMDRNPVIFFDSKKELSKEILVDCEQIANEWLLDLYDKFENLSYKYVGITSSYEQVNVSVAILKMIKKLNPEITTFIGGFNCEQEMAKGILSLDKDKKFIDYIFSGESEKSIIKFLNAGGSNNRIIIGEPLEDLDSIPNLDYSDYFDQLTINVQHKSLSMEHSRGCWWGEKSQCKFCGLGRVKFRKKSFSRIKNELEVAKKWGVKQLHMTDMVMPNSHLEDLLPYLKKNDNRWIMFFEQKVSLKYKDIKLLKESGVNKIQPGIESLNSQLLKKMGKGTSLKQNLVFLRDATTIGINVFWNIIWGIPGETIDEYRDMNKLIPLIVHLIPPVGLFHMTMVRFSPYFQEPEKYSIRSIKPIKSYYDVYPDFVDIDSLALMFKCEYNEDNITDTTEISKLVELLDHWNNKWKNNFFKPQLEIAQQGDMNIVLLDTRGIEGCEVKRVLNRKEIELLIEPSIYRGSNLENELIQNKVAIVDGDNFIPLVTLSEKIRATYGVSC